MTEAALAGDDAGEKLLGKEVSRHRRQLPLVGHDTEDADSQFGHFRKVVGAKFIGLEDLVDDDPGHIRFVRTNEPLDECEIIGDLVLGSAGDKHRRQPGRFGQCQRIEINGRAIGEIFPALDQHAVAALAHLGDQPRNLRRNRLSIIHVAKLRMVESDADSFRLERHPKQRHHQGGIIVPQTFLAVEEPIAERLDIPEPFLGRLGKTNQQAGLAGIVTRGCDDKRVHDGLTPLSSPRRIRTSSAFAPLP